MDRQLTLPPGMDVQDVSDGFHTFRELYDHRCLLFIKLASITYYVTAWKPHFKGWPVLFIESPAGQISYHFPEKYLPLVEAGGIPRDDDHPWDGHTSADVLERLASHEWLRET